MKSTINYLLCSAILLVGLALIVTDNIYLILAGLAWFGFHYKLSTKRQVRMMWKTFWKTNLKIEKRLGVD